MITNNSLFNKIQIILGEEKENDLMYHFALSIFTGKDFITYKNQIIDLTWWGYNPSERMLFEFVTKEKVYDTSLIDMVINAEKLCAKNGYYFIGPETKVLNERIMLLTLKVLDLPCQDGIYTYKTLE